MEDHLKFYIDGKWVDPYHAEDRRGHQPVE